MQQITHQFALTGSIAEIIPFGTGHINDTFRLVPMKRGNPEYLLQRINHRVFPDVPGMMNNIRLVTDHLRTRFAQHPACGQTSPAIIPALDGKPWFRFWGPLPGITPDPAGSYWRIMEFFADLKSYDLVTKPEHAYEGAKSFGYFLRYLEGLPIGDLVPVIPGFHDLGRRLAALSKAERDDPMSRATACRADLTEVGDYADRLLPLDRLRKSGAIPTRITHNDTKFNNVLLSQDDRGRAVIDLDTVMPGIVHYDLGDGLRTSAATAAEDERDLQLVGVNPELYRAFAEGYLEVTRDLLMPSELESLHLSDPYMSFIMGIRFLTDYLNGDHYYKIQYPEHNLVRARNQLRLTRSFLEQPQHYRFTNR